MSVELTHEDEKKIRARILRVHELLQTKYGKQVRECKASPFDELILTILSQNTTETRSRASFDLLKKRFKSWENLMMAPLENISKVMGPGGLKNKKALRLKRILRRIYRDKGSLTLDFLKEMEPKEAMKYLLSLKGIGARTASSVLLFSLHKPVMPVNTHIERVSKRLGWVWDHVDITETQEIFNRVTPRYLVMSLFSLVVKHGRVTCKVKKPNCTACMIKQDCDYYKKKAEG